MDGSPFRAVDADIHIRRLVDRHDLREAPKCGYSSSSAKAKRPFFLLSQGFRPARPLTLDLGKCGG